ncbi:MAG TPA: hypothetical protein PLA68_14495, partial [Panacibacter sp.]|nr:hypothetical protein [Panacibacter sp.]
ITFLKAAGLLLLAKILFGWPGAGRFGNFRHHRHGRMSFAGGMPRKHFGDHEAWKTRMQERWQNLSPEQKEKFASRCGKRFTTPNAAENTFTEESK